MTRARAVSIPERIRRLPRGWVMSNGIVAAMKIAIRNSIPKTSPECRRDMSPKKTLMLRSDKMPKKRANHASLVAVKLHESSREPTDTSDRSMRGA